MYYVEFLRVFRALRIYVVILLVVIAGAGIARVKAGTHWSNFAVASTNFSPSAKRSVRILPDGTELTVVVDNARGVRVEQRRTAGKIDVLMYDYPKHRSVYDPHAAAMHRLGRHIVTSYRGKSSGMSLFETTLADGTHVTHYVNDRHVPVDIFIVVGGFVAALFASVIGGSLSKENDGHLELAWTKPASRQTFALVMLGIDALGILGAGVLCVLTGFAIFAMFFGAPVPTGSADTAGDVAMAVLFPLAWYALGQAGTASLRRAGLLLGMLWVGALASIALLAVNNDVLRIVLRTINTINPIAYYSTVNGTSSNLLPATQTFDIIGLSAILVIAIVASLMQWRRLEA